MSSAHNIEVKASVGDIVALEDAVRALDCHHFGVQRQTDTYFVVPNGRLKLREIDDVRAELISYERPDETGSRTSSYRVVPVAEAAGLKAALTDALGVRGVVAKERRIYLWRNVRIHLDRVEGLGDYMEFEAVLSPDGDPEESRERVAWLSSRLGIREQDTIAGSYSDLLGR